MCAPVSPPVVVVFVNSMLGCSCDSVTTITLAMVITVMAPGTHHQLPRDEPWASGTADRFREGPARSRPRARAIQPRATGCEPARSKVTLEPRSFGHIGLTLPARSPPEGSGHGRNEARCVRENSSQGGQALSGPANQRAASKRRAPEERSPDAAGLYTGRKTTGGSADVGRQPGADDRAACARRPGAAYAGAHRSPIEVVRHTETEGGSHDPPRGLPPSLYPPSR